MKRVCWLLGHSWAAVLGGRQCRRCYHYEVRDGRK